MGTNLNAGLESDRPLDPPEYFDPQDSFHRREARILLRQQRVEKVDRMFTAAVSPATKLLFREAVGTADYESLTRYLLRAYESLIVDIDRASK